MVDYDAVVLAGGTGRRLGGLDKATVVIGSKPLLDRALEAVQAAVHVVVVGPARLVPHGVMSVSEDPPGGGPVAAIAAALPYIESHVVVVLACDMPLLTRRTVERLAAATAEEADGAILLDAEGRPQYLAAAYRTASLARALADSGSPEGLAARHVVARLTMHELATDPEVTLDCDTWEDVERSRHLLEGR